MGFRVKFGHELEVEIQPEQVTAPGAEQSVVIVQNGDDFYFYVEKSVDEALAEFRANEVDSRGPDTATATPLKHNGSFAVFSKFGDEMQALSQAMLAAAAAADANDH